MDQNLKDTELYKQIDEIIWCEWDPIGINDSEKARDEYYSYLPSLYKKLVEGADVVGIKKHLDHIEMTNMGLPGNSKRNTEIAEMLIRLRNELNPI